MNPFLHSCIAAPRSETARAPSPAARAVRGLHHRRGLARSRLARTVGALALAAGLGLAGSDAMAVDLNTATAEQLQSLRGIGPKTAQIILQERERGGRFESIEDLSDRVRGIGPKRAQALQAAGLTVGKGAGAAAKPPAKPAR